MLETVSSSVLRSDSELGSCSLIGLSGLKPGSMKIERMGLSEGSFSLLQGIF